MKELIERISNRLRRFSFSDGLVAFLLFVNFTPILAPVFAGLGLEFPAKVIYLIYSFTCHQMHWRSFHFFDYQVAWCVRDVGIWMAMLVTALTIKKYDLRGLKPYQILPFVVPIALDGGIQTIATAMGISEGDPLYVSNSLARFITGSIFGIGLGATMIPMITNFEKSKVYDRIKVKVFSKELILNFAHIILVIFFSLMFVYVGIVKLWDLTSPNNPPSNWLDSEVKVPEYGAAVIERRRNGYCPVVISAGAEADLEASDLTEAEKSSSSSNPFFPECWFSGEE